MALERTHRRVARDRARARRDAVDVQVRMVREVERRQVVLLVERHAEGYHHRTAVAVAGTSMMVLCSILTKTAATGAGI